MEEKLNLSRPGRVARLSQDAARRGAGNRGARGTPGRVLGTSTAAALRGTGEQGGKSQRRKRPMVPAEALPAAFSSLSQRGERSPCAPGGHGERGLCAGHCVCPVLAHRGTVASQSLSTLQGLSAPK